MKYLLAIFLSLASNVFAQSPPSCVFCEIIQGKREVSTVFRNDKVMAFLDHAPINPGHTLVIPIEHSENLMDTPPEVAREMMEVAQRIGKSFAKAGIKAEAFQLHMNNGPMIQHVKHAHLHVYPRFKGDFPGDSVVRLASQRERAERNELDRIASLLRKTLELNQLFAEYYEESLKLVPWQATFDGDPRYNDLFPDVLSDEYKAKTKAFLEKYLQALRAFDRDTLTPSEQINYDTLQWECEIGLAGLDFPTELLPINQFASLHHMVGTWAGGTGAQPFKTVRDYDNWLKRLDGFNGWCLSAVKRMRQGMAGGYVLPRALTQKVIPQFAKLAGGPVDSHDFYAPIRNMPPEFDADKRERLIRAYTDMIERKLIPAFSTVHSFLLNEYLPVSRASSGVSEIPRGKEFYELQIKTFTTLELTADEVHELGLKEVTRILVEMEKVKQHVAFDGTIREFFDHVRTNKSLMPFTDASQVIENFNAIHKKMQPSLETLFNVVPKTGFEVRRTEAFREKSASAEYILGSLDGKRPGIFYVPVPNVAEYNIFSDEALFLHEAIPGHHYQISLQREDATQPQFRRSLTYSAYAEGWALYCESLGKELGLYTDPYQYFGMLSAEMHRAIRLVVDTGLHAKGWSRERAISYSLDHEAESEDSVIAEIERYMAWPGQALSYKIGQLKIRELRARAEKQLGRDFDIPEFHNQILKTGSVPLKILERNVDDWIARKKKEQE